MKAKSILAALLLMLAGLQIVLGQGFRVYKSKAFQAFCTLLHFQAPENSYSFKMPM